MVRLHPKRRWGERGKTRLRSRPWRRLAHCRARMRLHPRRYCISSRGAHVIPGRVWANGSVTKLRVTFVVVYAIVIFYLFTVTRFHIQSCFEMFY